MSDRQAHASNTTSQSLARSKSLSGKHPQQVPTANGTADTTTTTATTSDAPTTRIRRSASQRGPAARRPSDHGGLRPAFSALTTTNELYNAVPAPPPHLRNEGALPVSPLATQDPESASAGDQPKLVRPLPVAFGASASGSAVVTPGPGGQSFYGPAAGITTLPDGSPISSPFNSAPPSRRGSFVSHPHASGPRPPVIRRRDSSASGYGYVGAGGGGGGGGEYPNLPEGQVYVDVDVATPSMLSRAGSPTLPLMTHRTASRSSSRRGSVADGVRPGFGFGLAGGGFEMSMLSGRKKEEEFVGSIDCGTTSTRFIIFDKYAKIICEHQTEYPQHYPHPNWHEHDPQDLVDSVTECIARAVEKLEFLGYSAASVKCIGITNQRETTLCWDRRTGKALCRAIVWDDARTVSLVREFQKKLDEEGLPAGEGEEEVVDYAQTARELKNEIQAKAVDVATNLLSNLDVKFNGAASPVPNPVRPEAGQSGSVTTSQEASATPTITSNASIQPDAKRRKKGKDALVDVTGLPMSTYFSAIKLKWMVLHHRDVREAYEQDRMAFGTVDSWLLYNLTGAADGGVHAIDVTNASRTLLMSIKTLEWYDPLLRFFDLKPSILPRIVSSSEVYGKIKGGPLDGIPIAGMIGDQQAALVGNKCLSKGEAKNTYGTGSFVLFNTGHDVVRSENGLISTLAYKLGPDAPPTYALEGSIAVAGSAIKWLRDQIGIIADSSEMDALCGHVKDTGGVYFVTAFSGLLAPYWDPNAGGMIVGLTQYSTSAHIARATLEAVCYQTRAVLDVIEAESGVRLEELKVDGGVTNSDLAMQIQADIGGFRICRPAMRESTALGSALLAGSAVGLFGWDLTKPETLKEVNTEEAMYFEPILEEIKRLKQIKGWQKAVERARAWHTNEEEDEDEAEYERQLEEEERRRVENLESPGEAAKREKAQKE